MEYFTKDFIDFLKELKTNNNRKWFLENKIRYDVGVKKPFEDFVQHYIYKLHEIDESLIVTPKEAIFRIYRDVRFSKDKTPYKTHVSALITTGGRKNLTNPGVYLEINSERLRFYGGVYQPSRHQLDEIRSYIAGNLEEFNSLISDKKFKRTFGSILGEKNKRIPKEYSDLIKNQPLIANKQFYFFKEIGSDKLLLQSLTNSLVKWYIIAKPLKDFFSKALSK